jgi:uncharacterized protein (TIGR02646 family)
MRPVAKGDWPLTAKHGKKMSLENWSRAIPILKARTGSYCHLCEMHVTNPIAIEHIFNRDSYPRLSANWSNFLLACSYCNSRKGAQRVEAPYRAKYFWPHLHNTLLKFEYRPDGVTRAHADLSPADRPRALRTISLYALDATKTKTGDLDQRHRARLQAWRIAIDRRIEFEKGICPVSVIVDSATLAGFFSVWLAVFHDREAVRAALIQCPAFHLAETSCLDAQLELVERR